MIVVDAERSRWCVVSDKTGKVLDGRPNHDAPETHEASILIPSISSFSPSSFPPSRLGPAHNPAPGLNLDF